MTRSLGRSLAALAALLAPAAALAHPHVWVTSRAEIVYAADGRVTGVRHRWTFDPAYSTYVTQGLDRNGDGQLSADELQELAKVNTESLSDHEFFTVLKANGAPQAFDAPRDAGMSFEKGQLTLAYLLPLKSPAVGGKLLGLEVYDPTFFVSFTLAEGDDAVRLEGAPKGCATRITRAKGLDPAQSQNLSESFFEALTNASAMAKDFANRVIVACP
jgi:ABC-type uncharacterized transport system substrate-binding protein